MHGAHGMLKTFNIETCALLAKADVHCSRLSPTTVHVMQSVITSV